jgi:predicted component of type VI protein secretion system
MILPNDSDTFAEEHLEKLLDTLPGFYGDDVENDESGLIQKLMSLLAAGISQNDARVFLKNKPVVSAFETGSNGFGNYLPDMLPQDLKEQSKRHLPLRSLAKIQYLLQYQSPAWPGAVQIIQMFFPEKTIDIEEGVFTQRVLPVERMSQLRGQTELGETSVLGFRLDDYMNRCRFKITRLNSEEAREFLGDSRLALLDKVLTIYLKQNLDVELLVELAEDVQQKTALGDPGQALLGKKTWLSTTVDSVKEITIRL